jgi:hypothetical protein
MSVPLQFDLIVEIVRHGAASDPSDTVDPSLNARLAQAGVALVTTYIEQLSLLDIVRDPVPMFGSAGGMWIGYRLTDRGRELASSDTELKRAVARLTGDATSEVSQAVSDLQAECALASLNEVYREDFLKTLDEIRICFDEECFIAVTALCGKILEVCLKELLIRNGITPDPNAMVGSLIRSIRERLPATYLDPSLSNVVNIVNTSRITAVHARESIPVPSRDQAVMVVFATRDVVRRILIAP